MINEAEFLAKLVDAGATGLMHACWLRFLEQLLILGEPRSPASKVGIRKIQDDVWRGHALPDLTFLFLSNVPEQCLDGAEFNAV